MEETNTQLPNESRAGKTQKRNRAQLSCVPCRASKLRCDREEPCGQCLKKDRQAVCRYTPRVEKQKPTKGMSARLRRLEGLVREMMDNEGDLMPKPEQHLNEGGSDVPQVKGHVVRGETATTYIGATHCMAMLEDIEDIKAYFDDDEIVEEVYSSSGGEIDASDILLHLKDAPTNRAELLAQIPERRIADQLLESYFSSMSPSQYAIHKPSFNRAYTRFWQDRDGFALHWLSQLFSILALGSFFDRFKAMSESTIEAAIVPKEFIKLYQHYAGKALSWGKYTHPNPLTPPALILFLESHYLFDRAEQMNSYLLSSTCLRILLKMGLHRDPSKLANLTPFEGEMRRRCWNMAMQIEILLSFHAGLPSMLQGVETDTEVPRNLHDDDFDENTTSLPPSRPPTDCTSITYAGYKTGLLRAFGLVAQQAHALSTPTYAEVMKIDAIVQTAWSQIPIFLKAKPLVECVSDPPSITIQRFGMSALYDKTRCVLHRRYLAELDLKPEHEYSRKQCLEGAIALLGYQQIIWQACQPGQMFSQYRWFVTSLALHDFILAAMILYLIIKNEKWFDRNGDDDDDDDDASASMSISHSRDELKSMLKSSHSIWAELASSIPELRKTAGVIAAMLAKVGCPVTPGSTILSENSESRQTNFLRKNGFDYETPSVGYISNTISEEFPQPSLSGTSKFSQSSGELGSHFMTLDPSVTDLQTFDFEGLADFGNGSLAMGVPWISGNNMDWRYFDMDISQNLAGDHSLHEPSIQEDGLSGVGIPGIDMSGWS